MFTDGVNNPEKGDQGCLSYINNYNIGKSEADKYVAYSLRDNNQGPTYSNSCMYYTQNQLNSAAIVSTNGSFQQVTTRCINNKDPSNKCLSTPTSSSSTITTFKVPTLSFDKTYSSADFGEGFGENSFGDQGCLKFINDYNIGKPEADKYIAYTLLKGDNWGDSQNLCTYFKRSYLQFNDDGTPAEIRSTDPGSEVETRCINPNDDPSNFCKNTPAPTSSYTFKPAITSISDKLYYGDKLNDDKPNAEGKLAFIGFNNDGKIIFDFYNTLAQPTIIIGNNIQSNTLKTPINPTTTYMQLIKVAPPNTYSSGKVGIEVYRNGLKYYEKYILIPRALYGGTYLLINGGSSTNPWTITRDGTPVLNANTPLSPNVIQNTPGI
jgi:hypothetical protein